MQFTPLEVMNILEDWAPRARCEEAMEKALQAFLASSQDESDLDGYGKEAYSELVSYAQEIEGHSIEELHEDLAQLKDMALGLNGWMYNPSDVYIYLARITIAHNLLRKRSEEL